jgi:hypothetical protein
MRVMLTRGLSSILSEGDPPFALLASVADLLLAGVVRKKKKDFSRCKHSVFVSGSLVLLVFAVLLLAGLTGVERNSNACGKEALDYREESG